MSDHFFNPPVERAGKCRVVANGPKNVTTNEAVVAPASPAAKITPMNDGVKSRRDR
jgi:hypothetical protein